MSHDNANTTPAGTGPVDRPVMQYTPGPWLWFERQPGRPYLATPDRGQLYVLGFERKGMQGAGPVFAHWPGIEAGAARERKGGIMEPGLLLRDGSTHPDARLISAAPTLAAALRDLVDVMTGRKDGETAALHNALFALRLATGDA
jgi:hypothetical protein